jgi:tetratricopeptide (TPR) repeat protein
MNLAIQLAQLEGEQLVRAVDADAYLFKHALTQETAYRSLLKKTRRDIHASVARTYEMLYADALDDYAAILAQHYAETDDMAKALEYEMRAGDAAARINAPSEALDHYTRALELAKQTPASSIPHFAGEAAQAVESPLQQLFLKRGRMLELSGEFELAVANYNAMLALAEEGGDRALKLAALMARATIHSFVSDVYNAETARELSAAALDIAQSIGDRASEAKILWNLSLLSSWAGKSRECVDYGERSIALSRNLGLREQLAYALNDISFGYLGLGDAACASEALDQARSLWRELDNRTMLGDNLIRSSSVNYNQARYDLVLKFAQEAYELSESIGNIWGQCESLSNVAGVLAEQGNFSDAITRFTRVIELSQKSGHAAMQVIGSINLAGIYESLGAFARAVELGENAHRLSENTFPAWHTWANAVLARMYLGRNDWDRVDEYAQVARAGLGDEDKVTLIPILLALAEISTAKRDYADALMLADRALEYANEMRFRPFLPETHYRRARALHAQDKAVALDALNRARTEAETNGSYRIMWQILFTLAELQDVRGNRVEAERVRTQAREILDHIKEHTPSEMRETFLKVALRQ